MRSPNSIPVIPAVVSGNPAFLFIYADAALKVLESEKIQIWIPDKGCRE